MFSNISKSEALALTGILILSIFVRFYGLSNQGLRTSDGGLYANQAWKVLLGWPEAIKDKPGHTLLIFLSYKALGVKMLAPLFLSAAVGVVFVGLIWLTVRHWYGVAAGTFTSLFAAVMPYLLFYHRGANSDGNLLTFLMAGILVYGLAIDRVLLGVLKWKRLLLPFCWAGLLFGLALSINYSMATTFVPVCLSMTVLGCVNRKYFLHFFVGGIALVIGMAIGYLSIVGIMWQHLEVKEFFRQIVYHSKGFSQNQFSLRSLDMLIRFVGIPPMVLAGIGLWRMVSNRRPFDIFCLALAGFMAASYLRSSLVYPRIYLPLCLPLLLCCGAGFEFIGNTLKSYPKVYGGVLTLLVIITFAFQATEMIGTVNLRSGNPAACEFLVQEGAEFHKGATTHSWWTFEAFTNHPFGYCSDVFAKKISSDQWLVNVERQIQRWYQQDYTHMVLDFHLWNRMSTDYNHRIEEFLKIHPPAFKVPNPAARHYQTVAEDGGLPEAGTNPLSEFIYIHRLKDF